MCGSREEATPDITTEELRAALAERGHVFGCGTLQRTFRRHGRTRRKDWPRDRAGSPPTPCSPDFNPNENAFARPKALLRKAAQRTVDAPWSAMGRIADAFSPAECTNDFSACGYDPDCWDSAPEREKIELSEHSSPKAPPKGRLEESLEHTPTFLGNPWKLYENGGFAFKRTVLQPAFAEPLRYSRDNGYRPAKTTFPFKVSAGSSSQKCGMVEPRGIEPLTSSLRTTRSPD